MDLGSACTIIDRVITSVHPHHTRILFQLNDCASGVGPLGQTNSGKVDGTSGWV